MNQCLFQTSSEKLLSAAGGDKAPQRDFMQRMRDFEILSLKWVISVKSFPSGLKEPEELEAKTVQELKGMQYTYRTRPSKSTGL